MRDEEQLQKSAVTQVILKKIHKKSCEKFTGKFLTLML